MEEFEFVDKADLNERSIFANLVCQLLVDKYDKNITKALKNVELIYNYFEIYVRNIYELIDTEIPLFSLYDLVRLGKDNWGFDDEEYKTNKQKALRACVNYYRLNLTSVMEWEENNL